MRTIEWTVAFERDYKRIQAPPRHRDLEPLLAQIAELLANDKPLAEKYRDHALGGEWNGLRECHMKPDLLLIYKLPDQRTLRLTRIGSHSQLFGK